MDLLAGQGGSLSYATRPPKEQGGAVDLLHPGALGWMKVRCDLVLLVSKGGQLYAPPILGRWDTLSFKLQIQVSLCH